MENNSISFIDSIDHKEESTLDFQPKQFSDYLGQEELKKKLSIYTKAALIRNEPLDHLLFFGPPGLGKTTIATIMANVMNVNIKITSGPVMHRAGDLVAILSSLNPRDILFIDEIHRMPTQVEEVLYNAMENFCVDIIIGQGASAKIVNLPISPFTLIGATTKSGMISAPLRTRFGITERLEYYNAKDLSLIVEQTANYLKFEIDQEASFLIGSAARGTPRIAKKITRRVRDIIQVSHQEMATLKVVEEALIFLGIDNLGLTTVDHEILKEIIIKFNGGPVGIETIAAIVGEDAETLQEVYEPYLLRIGYLEKTSRGRQIPHMILPKLKAKYLGQQIIF